MGRGVLARPIFTTQKTVPKRKTARAKLRGPESASSLSSAGRDVTIKGKIFIDILHTFLGVPPWM